MPQYINVIVTGVRGSSVLTYHTESELQRGQIVQVPLAESKSFAVVLGPAARPKFKTRAVASIPDLPPLPGYTLDTIEWMQNHYAVDAGLALKLFLPNRPDINPRTIDTATSSGAKLNPQRLNERQRSVLDGILQGENNWLLHGVTGSGKTAIYIELCHRVMAEGKSAIVLVPEIGLSTQIVTEFSKSLGPKVLTTHSHLSEARRRAVWRQAITAKEPLVVIGPRSALFTPLHSLGAVIIDECHEPSYKQEQAPYYHAREVATYIAGLTGSKLVLGSATPGTQDIHYHHLGQLRLASLPEPIHSNVRKVEIIDMRRQQGVLSRQLISAIGDTLNSNKQSLLFINRRGSASQVVCSRCGFLAKCGGCDTPQTWHADSGRLRCHWCGREDSLPGKCPGCKSLDWRFLGFGTKRIETEVTANFPDAKVFRLDKDSFSATTIKDVMHRLKTGDIDILIGTQMVAKGLDLPLVNLVGVVSADTMLHIPDLGSNERTYQLLHQIIGRAGRSQDSPSRVLIQTYNPDNQVINSAARHDFDGFIDQELAERQDLGYPPFSHLLKLTCRRKTAAGAKGAATRLGEKIRTEFKGQVTVRGPAPAWRERINDNYYWHLIVTAPERQPLLEVMQQLPANWMADIDPADLL